jgi:hypothetical protein
VQRLVQRGLDLYTGASRRLLNVNRISLFLSTHFDNCITLFFFLSTAVSVDGNQEAKKRRRKAPLVLDFQDIPNFGKHYDSAGSYSKLNQTTLLQWLTEKITLPEDLQVDLKEFYQ